MYSLYIYGISFHIVNITREECHLFSKSQHDYKCDFDFMQQFNKQEVNIKRLVLDTIFPAFALFLQQK